jgi:hypothetical protein
MQEIEVRSNSGSGFVILLVARMVVVILLSTHDGLQRLSHDYPA